MPDLLAAVAVAVVVVFVFVFVVLVAAVVVTVVVVHVVVVVVTVSVVMVVVVVVVSVNVLRAVVVVALVLVLVVLVLALGVTAAVVLPSWQQLSMSDGVFTTTPSTAYCANSIHRRRESSNLGNFRYLYGAKLTTRYCRRDLARGSSSKAW